MARILDKLADLDGQYDLLFCDLWGCVHDGQTPYPAAIAALQAFRSQGGRVVLVSNAPRPRREVTGKLDDMGVPRDAWDAVATSGDAAQIALFDGKIGTKVWHLGPVRDEPFFVAPDEMTNVAEIERVSLEDAEGIACTGLFEDGRDTPEDYREVLQTALDRGLPMLCANPDVIVDVGEERQYCAGALAELYADMGGDVSYYGKPHAPVYDLARERVGAAGETPKARTLCVGDGIATDALGGDWQGIDCIFVTGGLAASQMGPDPEHPIEENLEAFLETAPAKPRYAIGRLR